MKSIQAGCWTIALSVIFLSVTGCGGTSDQPDLGQVTGTVTLDGKPLSDTAIVFYPDSGRPARGLTDAEGKYELIYIRDTRGTKLGHNRVEIAPSEEAEDEDEEETDEDTPQVKRPAKSKKPKIPARYNTKTELEADVKPGDNTFDFKLESK
ncbi:hypothetical protein DTL42_16855 [Bremerella cremea]|uniref:Carboxypeptidase regulatory-like domain-containing protein n=1 Tax=Bremerella cremea TaxID=1031537 RepID=A0A368KN29_9BACT|nr:hypothetical protein [Bremerella cremea]RCS44596.1 hypothetical protein DTL42_16855 [Bremerella cremea]